MWLVMFLLARAHMGAKTGSKSRVVVLSTTVTVYSTKHESIALTITSEAVGRPGLLVDRLEAGHTVGMVETLSGCGHQFGVAVGHEVGRLEPLEQALRLERLDYLHGFVLELLKASLELCLVRRHVAFAIAMHHDIGGAALFAIEVDHRCRLPNCRCELRGLRDVAGEAIDHDLAIALDLVHSMLDDLSDDVPGDMLTTLDSVRNLPPCIGTALGLGTQEVGHRDVMEHPGPCQAHAEHGFAGERLAQDEDDLLLPELREHLLDVGEDFVDTLESIHPAHQATGLVQAGHRSRLRVVRQQAFLDGLFVVIGPAGGLAAVD